MHNGTLVASITREVLAYFSASDEVRDTITLDMIRDRDRDRDAHTWRVTRARKALAVVLLENGGITTTEVADYIERDIHTVWWYKRDLQMLLVMGGHDAAEWARDLRNVTGRLLKYGGYESDTNEGYDGTEATGPHADTSRNPSRFERRGVPRTSTNFGKSRLELKPTGSGDNVPGVARLRQWHRKQRHHASDT